MTSIEKFYGGALDGAASHLYGIPARVINVTDTGEIYMPSRSRLCPGGPYFILKNADGSTVALKEEAGTLIKTLPGNSITTISLGLTRWVAGSRPIGGVTTLGHDTAARAGVPFGYVPTVPTVSEPSAYDPIVCDGGYRRAHFCSTGAWANIWMLDADVTPNFVDGIAAFTFQGNGFFFRESNRLVTGRGFTLTAADVVWTGADCPDTMDTLLCDYTNPNWPKTIKVRITDTVNVISAGRNDLNVAGDWTLYSNGTSQYRADFNTPKPAGYCILSNMSITAECDSGGWEIVIQYNSSEATHSEFYNASPRSAAGPTIGAYPWTTGGGTSGFGGAGAWNASTVTVLGYGA